MDSDSPSNEKKDYNSDEESDDDNVPKLAPIKKESRLPNRGRTVPIKQKYSDDDDEEDDDDDSGDYDTKLTPLPRVEVDDKKLKTIKREKKDDKQKSHYEPQIKTEHDDKDSKHIKKESKKEIKKQEIKKKKELKLDNPITAPDNQGVYYPKKKDVISYTKKRPHLILRDNDGRLYGRMPPNPLMDAMLKSGELSDDTDFFAWVYLPSQQIQGNRRNNDTRTNDIKNGDDLQFPAIGDRFNLYSYIHIRDPPITRVVVIGFPEKIRQFGRSADVILQVIPINNKRDI